MLMMWALKVSRSTTAAARRGSVKVWPHSLKELFDAVAIEARSSRSVMIWKSSSAPRETWNPDAHPGDTGRTITPTP